jgi:hypothetical protein
MHGRYSKRCQVSKINILSGKTLISSQRVRSLTVAALNAVVMYKVCPDLKSGDAGAPGNKGAGVQPAPKGMQVRRDSIDSATKY